MQMAAAAASSSLFEQAASQEHSDNSLKIAAAADPNAKLRQLQMDNERYRASMENSTQKLQAQILSQQESR